MSRAREIAEGLSGAQREALVEIPSFQYFTPANTGFQWPTLAVLKSKRLIAAREEDTYGKNAEHYITITGIKVRKLLMEQENG